MNRAQGGGSCARHRSRWTAATGVRGEVQVRFMPAVRAHLMQRYRFRNTFTDECYFVHLEQSPDDENVQGVLRRGGSGGGGGGGGRARCEHKRWTMLTHPSHAHCEKASCCQS